MERLEKQEWLGLAVIGIVAAFLLSYLPFHGQMVFLSPDETGVFAAAKSWAEQGTSAIQEPLAKSIPWLHPRSWISHDLTIVPVGFLGWPWIISWFIAILGARFAAIAAMLIILSCVYPTYRLLRPIGKASAFIGTVVAVTSPAFLLYGNRSLFPNAAIMSLAIWSGWMFRDLVVPAKAGTQNQTLGLDSRLRGNDRRYRVMLVLFGCISALALSIRPVEAVWIIPWFLILGWGWRPTVKQAAWIVFGVALVVIPLAWEAQMIYGGFWKAGYWMRGNPLVTSSAPAPQNIYSPELFPFGIHPKSIAWNSYKFLGQILFPWMLPLLMMFALVLYTVYQRVIPTGAKRSGGIPFLKRFLDSLRSLGMTGKYVAAGLWTFLFLVLYYGNGRYLDNINGNATIGNSFIRYLLPLGFLSALALAWIYRLASISKYGRIVVLAIAVLMSCTGIWRAYAADEEGLLAGRRELDRYAQIRQSASQYFKPGDIIISDRSDKIFFPAYRAISPIPPADETALLGAAVEQGVGIGLFARPMPQAQIDQWRKVGLEPVDLATFGREKLYRLQPIRP